MKKGKIFRVTDSSIKDEEKTRSFQFIPVDPDNEKNEPLCKTHCPYGIDQCSIIPDPRESQNPDKCFQDYCFELSDEGEQFSTYVPQRGTIEEGMRDVDIFRPVITKGSLVNIRDVIHTMCKDVCDRYNENLSGCTSDNQFCILHDILINRDIHKSSINTETDAEEFSNGGEE